MKTGQRISEPEAKTIEITQSEREREIERTELQRCGAITKGLTFGMSESRW